MFARPAHMALVAVIVAFGAMAAAPAPAAPAASANPQGTERPNILLIVTDDQGFGDFGFTRNPVLQTPHLDKLAAQSVRLTQFYVSPVCSPTRASLLTGRYNYRTGVVDTYLGRSMMQPQETTLAEMLRNAGYRTGIFGKWHLGDNYPMRPGDQGFCESLVIRGGGLGQPSDLPGGNLYNDPVLLHNGKPEARKGYCSDVFTDGAMAFVEGSRRKPFFCYLAFNAPHEPLGQVPKRPYEQYKAADLSPGRFLTPRGYPLPPSLDADKIARVYAMVSNIDDNVGRLMKRLDALGLTRDTIIVFLTDNGPAFPRYNAGQRGLKGTVYEGGIHVPCLVRWPGGLGPVAGSYVDRVAAHIDLVPTLLDAAGVNAPDGVKLDGTSLLPLMKGDMPNESWPDRTLYFQWHRGDAPEKGRAFAARSQGWKLVQALGTDGKPFEPRYELYDIASDPSEMHDQSREFPERVEQLRAGYEQWFADVTGGDRGALHPPLIMLGAQQENPVTLTRQDWRGPRAGWDARDLGYWDVEVLRSGRYVVTLDLGKVSGATAVHLRVGKVDVEQPASPTKTEVRFGPLQLPAGPTRIEPWVNIGSATVGVRSVEVARVE
jgi:arylsulfatase A-like enzyme